MVEAPSYANVDATLVYNRLLALFEVTATKATFKGVVGTDGTIGHRMEKSVVVSVERQVRHGVYGKTQRRTSKFMAHNEDNAAKVGDRVAVAESRPLSRRKRWAVTRIVAKAPAI